MAPGVCVSVLTNPRAAPGSTTRLRHRERKQKKTRFQRDPFIPSAAKTASTACQPAHAALPDPHNLIVRC